MSNSKLLSTLLASYFKLNYEQVPTTEKWYEKCSYASTIGSLMYVMVCIWPNISHDVGIVSRVLSNSGKDYW